jgi:hypothetical protein
LASKFDRPDAALPAAAFLDLPAGSEVSRLLVHRGLDTADLQKKALLDEPA